MVVWKIAGFTMIILMTGLQAIPHGSAGGRRIDGARPLAALPAHHAAADAPHDRAGADPLGGRLDPRLRPVLHHRAAARRTRRSRRSTGSSTSPSCRSISAMARRSRWCCWSSWWRSASSSSGCCARPEGTMMRASDVARPHGRLSASPRLSRRRHHRLGAVPGADRLDRAVDLQAVAARPRQPPLPPWPSTGFSDAELRHARRVRRGHLDLCGAKQL